MARDDAGDDVGEASIRVDVVHLRGFDQRGDGRPVIGAAVGAGEERVLAIEGDRVDRALDGVGVDLDAAVVENEVQPFPTRQSAPDRLGELALAADERELSM